MTTIAPRKLTLTYAVGDVVLVDGTRWLIRAISPKGRVTLSSMNHPNASIWWSTTLTKLPRKDA